MKNKEAVNHPDHYNDYSVEVIDMMVDIWGHQKVADFCEINAFKYRMRMGLKDSGKIDEDLRKERWYINKKNELLEIMESTIPEIDLDVVSKFSRPTTYRLDDDGVVVPNGELLSHTDEDELDLELPYIVPSEQADWDEYHNQDG